MPGTKPGKLEQRMQSLHKRRAGRKENREPTSVAYVHDGRTCVGHVIGKGPAGFEAFDREDKSLGLFKTQAEAAAALPGGEP